MNIRPTSAAGFLPAAVLLVAAAALAYVLATAGPNRPIPMREPLTGQEAGADTGGASPLTQTTLKSSGGTAPDLPGGWPGFRGPNRDGVATDPAPLASSWPKGGPKTVWSVDAGEGYAGAAIHKGRVYLMDYDREASRDALRCLSLAEGNEIWRLSYPVSVKRNHGMSRTVPAVTDRFVVALGPKCHVICADAVKGTFLWGVDLVRDYGTTVPAWYAGQCPLIDGDRVILAPCGSHLMVALDLASGKVIWKTPNPKGWKMTHVSIAPMEIAGRRTYVYCGHRGVAGVAADDGTILWETGDWKISIATVSTPVPVPGGRIFLSGGYEAGAMMLQVDSNNGTHTARTLFRLDAATFGATQQTPVFYQDHLYGVRPSGELVCLETGDGRVLWTSGNRRFGLGPFIVADGKILALDDDGDLTMAEAAPSAYKELASAKVLAGHDAWGPLALAGRFLILRDLTRVTCLDLGTPSPP